MARKRDTKNLSFDDLRSLMIEKKRRERQARHDHFAQTGELNPGLDHLRGGSERVSIQPGMRAFETVVQPRQRTWVDRFLFIIEAAAVLGLLAVLLSGISQVQFINREASAMLSQPTLTPTPLIMALVLPSGHTPPESPGGVRPNDAEIPEHLRPLVQSMPDLPVPTRGPQQAIRIQIPAIGVDKPVIQGDGWEQLKKGVGQHIGTPNPGERGNLVLSAHNDVFGEIFRDLDQLNEGDTIVLFTSQRSYTYIVQQVQIVEPTQVEVMAPSQEPVVTLISCYPYLVDDMRIVVSASLQE